MFRGQKLTSGGLETSVETALVLVVEDEEPIRFLVNEGLTSSGYSTLEATNVADALALLEQHPIDLAFIDVGLPGKINGADLAFLIQERWPDIQIIVGSGNFDPKSARLPAGSTFIAKPYRWHSLNKVITQQLLKKKSRPVISAESRASPPQAV